MDGNGSHYAMCNKPGREIQVLHYLTHVESKNNDLRETDSSMVVTGIQDEGRENGKKF